jgi:hypothetical protein
MIRCWNGVSGSRRLLPPRRCSRAQGDPYQTIKGWLLPNHRHTVRSSLPCSSCRGLVLSNLHFVVQVRICAFEQSGAHPHRHLRASQPHDRIIPIANNNAALLKACNEGDGRLGIASRVINSAWESVRYPPAMIFASAPCASIFATIGPITSPTTSSRTPTLQAGQENVGKFFLEMRDRQSSLRMLTSYTGLPRFQCEHRHRVRGMHRQAGMAWC